MVIEAVQQLNDRNGSTIASIRKYIQNNFEYARAQVSSFNKLTMNALANAVEREVLDKNKHSYKISNKEKEKRKEETKSKKKL
jgi:hypothetical protein